MSRLQELIDELCPNGVEFKNLEQIADIGTGSHNTNEGNDEGEYPFYVRSQEPLRLDAYDYDETAIIIAGDGVGVGKVFHYVEGKYALHQRAYRIHINTDSIVTKFIFHYMKATFLDYIEKNMFKGSVASIRRPMLNAYKVPVPPMEVQSEIVRVLESFMSLTNELANKLTDELTARKRQYEYYASKLFSDDSYEWVPMSELADFVYGYTDKASESGNARFVRITDIDDNGYLKATDKKYIVMTEEAKKSQLSKGDIIMARTGATYGKTLYFDEDEVSVYASFLIKIIPDGKRLLNKYYWHFTKTQLYWGQANKLVSTGGQPQFNTPAVKRIKIPLPSIERQQKIVDILDKLDEITNDYYNNLPAEIEVRKKQYEYYREQLLDFKEIVND